MTLQRPHKRQNLLQTVATLSNEERAVLQLLAVLYTPIPDHLLKKCLLAWPAFPSQSLETTPLSFIIKRLVDKKLISGQRQCHAILTEPLTREMVAAKKLNPLVKIIRRIMPPEDKPSQNTCLREMRFGLYLHDFDHFNYFFLRYHSFPTQKGISPLTRILNNPFSSSLILTLPIHLRIHALQHIVTDSLSRMLNLEIPLLFLLEDKNWRSTPKAGLDSLAYLRGVCFLFRGEFAKVKEHCRFTEESGSFGIYGWLAFCLGQIDDSLDFFESDLKILRRQNGADFFFPGPEGFFFLLALLKKGDFSQAHRILHFIKNFIHNQPDSPLAPCFQSLQQFIVFRRRSFGAYSEPPDFIGDNSPLSILIANLCYFWIHHTLPDTQISTLRNCTQKARHNGFEWLATEFSSLADPGKKTDAPSFALAHLIPPQESWQRALSALSALKDEEIAEFSQPKVRLAWLIDFSAGFLTISPRLQKRKKTGIWPSGRPVSLQRLFNKTQVDFLNKQDHEILSTLKEITVRGITSYDFDMSRTLPTLIGHPLLFLAESPETPVEITAGVPELFVSKQGDQLLLRLTPEIGDEPTIAIREDRARFKIVKITPEHRRIVEIIGSEGLLIPEDAKDQVLGTLGILSSSVTVHSEIGPQASDVPHIPSDPTPVLQLTPVGSGFRLAMLIRPFGAKGPYLTPTYGAHTLIAEMSGKKQQTHRDFDLEKQKCQNVIASCPILEREDHLDYQWQLSDPESCLVLLEELQALQEPVRLEWPEGEKLRITNKVDFRHIRMKIKKKGSWFEVDGSIELDQDKVMDMRQLLQLVQNRQSRFIPLQNGQFISLSRALRRHLHDFAVASRHKDKEIILHPLAVHMLDTFEHDGSQLSGTQAWHNQRQRIIEAQKLEPSVPSTLQAKLRDYQIEGFRWMSRIAHWGGGACLADDMGLGKTIQALAVILERASEGPSLVIAPTSVCLNWQAEVDQFSPTLRPIIFGQQDRTALMANLGPFDLIIASYGLLQQEEKLFSEINWQTIILDEAQAIKNMTTKRSKAAMNLQAKFKAITTGTPIENHLGELWNLFNFINPGLLGSLKDFNQNFAIPIERHNDSDKRRILKKILQPFVLRRLKSQVLEELPSRTEIVLKVEMSQEEVIFYEALRQESLAGITNDSSTANRPMKILAAITRLRQASCHPRLVSPTSNIPSSKLNLFAKVIDDLLENNHKALVFSQFVSHLTLIREHLDARGISYQYLDGSTPPVQRQKRVDSFQNGEGDLFLISLKAGGVGLNLTAADYVIHMDPWWNPAVEDQASDRAHRIGQIHPVTIYRLVCSHTIEEKILSLHREKKDLADSLLEGTDMPTRLDTEALLTLLQENRPSS
ncbi:MAG: DEAD/DEAH box helicase [Proteobacteria bacterium]|nr:DEAD/DEAH box helicase [Pseudomonadota bacterium]MBU1640330.1 DEAD/DEAH box helicase [Pseudomonadota bacterium]